MTKEREALKLALEALKWNWGGEPLPTLELEAITAIEQALALPEQEPVAYDKTELNCFAQDLYDEKMREGKHGNYETIFHVVHQAIKRVPPQRTWVGLSDGERSKIWRDVVKWGDPSHDDVDLMKAIEAKLKEKNNG